MILQKLAEKLIEGKAESESENLLKSIPETDLVKLAIAVKEICYSFWTSEPTKAQASAKALENIYRFSPQKEIEAYSEWINGIAEITRGNLVSAIERLDNSADAFLYLEKKHEAAQTQVAKLYSLALLGNYEQAIKTGDKALQVFRKNGDELAAGKIEKNIGNIYWRRDFYEEAEKRFLLSKKRFEKIENYEELTMVEHCLATVCTSQNKFRQAEKFYLQALRHAKEAKMFVTEAEIEASMGNLSLFRGKFDEALKFSELSRRKYETLKMPHQTAIAKLEVADIYLELNLTTEAISIYEKVVDELHELKLQGEEARARANFGRVAAVLNETNKARREFKKAARLYVLEKNRVGAAAVKLSEATLELGLGNHRKVLKLALEAEGLLEQFENIRYRLTARLLEAEALGNLNDNENARKILSDVYTQSIKYEQPNTAQSAQISLGAIAVKQKNFRQAEKHFRQAIRLIETLRAPLAAEEFRMAFLANKLAPYENLAKIYLTENKLKRAFVIIERARARVLAESLSGDIPAIDTGQNKVPGKLSKRLESLREELNWFYSRLGRADETAIENLQLEAKKREKQIAEVMRQIESTRTEDAGVSAGRADSGAQTSASDAAKFKQLQNRLGGRQALIEFVNFDGVLSAFVVTDKKIHYIDNLAKETEIVASLESLQFQFDALRYGAKSLGGHLGELKKRADFYLRKLHEKLIEPLEKFFGERNLVIVPVGALHYVPFHALTNGENYLIQTREIVYSPSATVWQFLASKPIRKLKTALLMGYADERIPFVNAEIEILHDIFRQSKSYTGEQATFAAFTKNAAHFDILHFACHGNFRPENPLFSSLHLADGWITVRDICSQNLKAEIVTLSACETGLNKIFAGNEILGLARGFLSAGASSLVLSLWTVNDEAATVLMKSFYAELRTGRTAAEALQTAQCSFIERELHPYFWSPFALIGR